MRLRLEVLVPYGRLPYTSFFRKLLAKHLLITPLPRTAHPNAQHPFNGAHETYCMPCPVSLKYVRVLIFDFQSHN